MAVSTDKVSRQLLETEARDWLRRGYTNSQRVAELQELIASKRGNAAAKRLLE